MQNLELSFASKESSLSVRSFSVEQRLSSLFEIGIVAVSPSDDLDLDAIVGKGATFRIGAGFEGFAPRAFTGICNHLEQVEAESSGLSTYYLRIVPEVWRATRRKNSRIFQHLTIPEIAQAILAEWDLVPVLHLDPQSFPRFEYRVQYGETDFSFLSRLLEEAGITYTFRDPGPATEDDPDPQTTIILATDLHRDEERAMGSLLYFSGKEAPPQKQVATAVKIAQEVRAGKLTLRDYDFRSRPDFELIAEARAMNALEDRLEVYEYEPGAFLVEPGTGLARVDEKEAKALVSRRLSAQRGGRKALSFRTNVLDLAPGVIFTIHGHPRADIDKKRLLTVRQTIEGTHDGEWSMSGQAVYADEPHRPALVTPRPRIPGVQSALVVGPAGEEIHTDEHGRVRVQFHWDRYGTRNEQSSCFLRVSQGWAGAARGAFTLPRVGDEVLVGFYEGDPDQPVVVGRVHNSATRAPLSLPAEKTRSTWKTESTPGGGGYNELTFEDQKGEELVYLRAERDLTRLVQVNESVTIGGSLNTTIGQNESRDIHGDQTLHVAGNRSSQVDGSETIAVSEELRLQIGESGTGLAVSKDKRIVLTTGGASIVLDGNNIYFDAQAMVQISSAELVSLSGGEVHIDGQPNVYLNSGQANVPGVIDLDLAFQGMPAINLPYTDEEKVFESLLSSPVEVPDGAPDAIVMPPFVDEQLEAAKKKVGDGIDEFIDGIKDRIDLIKEKIEQKALELKENLVPRVEAARAEAYALINKLRAQIEKVKAEAAAKIAELKAKIEMIRAEVEAKIQMVKDKIAEIRAKAEALIKSIKDKIEEVKARAKALIDAIKQRIAEVKAQFKALFDDLRKQAIAALNGAKSLIDSVKSAIETARQGVKDIVASIKDAIESVKNEIKQAVDDVKQAMEQVKKDVKAIIGGAKELVNDIKQGWKDIKNEAKDAAKEIKQEFKDLKQEFKDDVKEIKQESQDFLDQAKQFYKKSGQKADGAPDLFGGAPKHLAELPGGNKPDILQTLHSAADGADSQGQKQLGGLPLGQVKEQAGGPFINLDKGGPVKPPSMAMAQDQSFLEKVAGAAQGANHAAGDAQSSVNGASAIAKSTVVTRAGGFGGEGLAMAVNGTAGATFLQSPSEGQLMILRTQAATPLTPSLVSSQVVDHQMNGLSSSDAFAAVLKQNGYAVYERPFHADGAEFLKKAVL
ncbi:MAG: type VI secretion system tip protein TssI/VgrG [Byssovorax sp.]